MQGFQCQLPFNYLSSGGIQSQSRERESLGGELHSNDVSESEKLSGYQGDAATN